MGAIGREAAAAGFDAPDGSNRGVDDVMSHVVLGPRARVEFVLVPLVV